MEKSANYSLGLALSGGGAKGFAHLGVLQAMEEKGLKPDIISGTSAGALAGVLYADGYSPQEALNLFQHKEFKDFAAFSIPKGGLFKTDKLYAFLEKYLRAKTFEELKTPMKITATDIENGAAVTFDKGVLVPVVVASCSYPILFTPTVIGGKHYVDGGLFMNFPVSVIRDECEKVIGVNVSPLTLQKYKDSLLHVAERSFHYMSVYNTLIERDFCDLLIESVDISKYAMFTLDDSRKIYQLGYEIAKNKLEEL